MSLLPCATHSSDNSSYFVKSPSVDPTRIGTIIGTGSVQSIACPSIVSGSSVRLAFVAGTAPAVAPTITITEGVGFELTLPADATYNYEVMTLTAQPAPLLVL